MPLIEERYDQQKIDSLKRYLQREADKGRHKDYEIVVDGFKIVPRTNDLAEFDDYEDEIKPATRNVSILIYDGTANRNTRYSFSMQGQEQAISGIGIGIGAPQDLNGIIQEKLDARDREHEMAQLREKLEDTEQQLEEAEEFHDIQEKHIRELEEKIRGLESGEIKKRMELGDMAGLAIQGLLRANAKNITSLPGGQALAGILGLNDHPVNSIPAAASEEVNVSFEKKSEKEEDKEWQQYKQQMMHSFPNDLNTVFAIINVLAQQPEQINKVAEFLNLKTEQS